MLDTDDTSEVLAAAACFKGAIDAANEHVSRVTPTLTPCENPGSAIDDALVSRAARVCAAFDQALAASAASAAAVYRDTWIAVRALEDADATGKACIERSESD